MNNDDNFGGEEQTVQGVPFTTKDQEIRFHMLGVCQGNLEAAKIAYDWVMASAQPPSCTTSAPSQFANGSFWVIESYFDSALRYWTVFSGKSEWCTRTDDAVRFGDFGSAAKVLSHMAEGCGRVAQHAMVKPLNQDDIAQTM